MYWDGLLNSHRDEFRLEPVCQAKSTYLKTANSTHANDQFMKFRVESDFSVEARKQLAKQLPENLRQTYNAHERHLDHLGKSFYHSEDLLGRHGAVLNKRFQG